MALITCHECQNPVSTEAASCPKCGAPVKVLLAMNKMSSETASETSGCGVAVGVVLIAALVVIAAGWAWSMINASSEREAAAERAAVMREEARRLANQNPDDRAREFAAAERAKKSAPLPVSRNESVPVPSDPRANYYVVSMEGRSPIILVTQRNGSSGVSYSKREIECSEGSLRYLGTGDTLAEMEASAADPERKAPIEGSIASDILKFACGKIR